MFPTQPQNVSFPKLEEEILAFWKEHNIYQQSLEQRSDAPSFVFYEGPPTANGKPHPGHCLTRAIKDLFPRYKTMRGFRCERKAGWDTHGLPVEVEVCKELGIHSKEEIEAYGVEPFIQKCQASVWRYMQDWERLTERLGFWVNLDDAYVTYHQSYVESVWHILKNLFDRGLLYEGHKIVWWWAQGGTALSSGEVGQGYREVADPSVYVLFPLVEEPDTCLVAWTTTPWTLPSNQFAAVHPELTYVKAKDEETGKTLVVAEALVEQIGEKLKRELVVVEKLQGTELVGQRYIPPFDYYHKELGDVQGKTASGEAAHVAWNVRPANFVTTDSGSGIVHIAPAFGEVDYEILIAEQERFAEGGPELICAVGPDGKFTNEAGDYKGRWVKEADKDLARDVKERGLLLLQEQYLHDYPFCWRAEQDPLIQYPRRSWFVKTTQFKDQMLANNQKINWLPDHIQNGRFGNFLESNVDWALSRERYWGTPLPVWVCEETGKMEAVGGYEELLSKAGVQGDDVWEKAKATNPELPEDLKVHKPYIDAITYDSPFAPGAKMKRVSEVIDCWFDSGAMPFAQWGFPKGQPEKFKTQYPADFISEAIDQTRGWFYSLLAISTLMLSDEENNPEGLAFPYPFKNCIVLGLMLSEWYEDKEGTVYLNEEQAKKSGKKFKNLVGKMSKSKRNYSEPGGIFDTYGADALRWYFFANQAPWTSIRYSERAIKESIPEFLLRLWNVFSFFTIYANIDGFDPAASVSVSKNAQLDHTDFAGAKGFRPVAERSELDRWVLSELNQTLASVTSSMDEYANFEACQQINEFVDGLSNWYVRRSRDRYWSSDKEDPNKLDAYWTLYECLLTTTKMIAPFTPFFADYLWRNLSEIYGDQTLQSAHLCDYPTGNAEHVDATLCEQMNLVREIASLGRSARMNNKLKVRQPLSKVTVILADDKHRAFLDSHSSLIATELNVKEVAFTTEAEKYISYQIQPNFKLLGPMLGKDLPEVKKLLGAADGNELSQQLATDGKIELTLGSGNTVELNDEQIQRRLSANEGWAAAEGKQCVVVLSTELTPSLIREGYARDMVRYVQDLRKALGCEFTDRIRIGIGNASDEVRETIEEFGEHIRNETLADAIELDAPSLIREGYARGHGALRPRFA